MKRFALILLLALGAAGPVAAVECEDSETPVECWTRAMGESRTGAEEQVKEEEAEDLKEEPTGVQTAGENLASNTTDFLPLLALSGLLGDVQEGETPGTYALDLNFLIPGLAKDKNSKFQALYNSQPMVSTALAEQIPEDERDELVGKIQEGLGSDSDYALSFSFSWMDHGFGRGFNQYRRRVSSLVSAAVAKYFEMPDSESDATRLLLEVLADIPQEGGQNLFETSFEDMGEQGPEVKAAVEAALEQEIDLLARNRADLAASGLQHLGDLIDNQPQLTFSAVQRFRDPVVGGDETAIKVTYEWGVTNFNNALSDDCHDDLDKAAPEAGARQSCLDAYTTYVEENKDAIDHGQKLSVSAEYVEVDGEQFDLPDLGLTGLTLKDATKLVIQAGWSRQFAAGGSGVEPVRLDFVGKYEDVSDDPMRRDRGVATLTVTRQFGGLAVPFGIVWANHGQYLGEVDQQLSAHLGIKFDLEGNGGN
ncbi:MAG TPA: hypothetical protein VF179_32880 [Thermoanaerobaculia bacterium]|nr:hypothetical protein [Thermoanaerobaculia bacterium]